MFDAKYAKDDFFYHPAKGVFLQVDSTFTGRDGAVGYALKVLGPNPYETSTGKVTEWVRYFERRLKEDCKKVDNNEMLRIVYGEDGY